MQLAQQCSVISRIAKPALAGFLVLVLLFLGTLAASPTLHQWFHPDANAPSHDCVITLFAKGQVSAATVAPLLVGLVILFGGVALLPEMLVLPSADYRFSSSRAPPFFRSHLA
jgi:hypothetical protein